MSGFKKTFSRQDCNIHFMGVWDTVAAVGWLAWRRYYKHRRPNPEIHHAYHAVAVDENRLYFQVSDWDEVHTQKTKKSQKNQESQESRKVEHTLEQVWFPGYHSDVGGYRADPKISNIPLRWMLERARDKELKLKDHWDDDLDTDPRGEIRSPRQHIWILAPTRKRTIPNWANIHSSVDDRMALVEGYRPKNVPPEKDRVKPEDLIKPKENVEPEGLDKSENGVRPGEHIEPEVPAEQSAPARVQ